MIERAVHTAPGSRSPALSWQALDACEQLLAAHMAEAMQRFGAGVLGLIDLPPITSGSLSPAQLRVAAVLFWASEVEQAGLLPFTEALAEHIVRGTLALPLTDGADELVRYWRARDERYGVHERHELFQRIFGAGNDPYQNPVQAQLHALVDALGEIGRTPADRSTTHLQARVNVIARDLAGMLSDRSVGMAAYAARDIVQHVRTAMRLLGLPDIVQSLGRGGPWTMIRLHSPMLLGRQIDPTPHLARAQNGQVIVEWMATVAQELEHGTARVLAGDPVVHAALAWSAEVGMAAPAPRPAPPGIQVQEAPTPDLYEPAPQPQPQASGYLVPRPPSPGPNGHGHNGRRLHP